ncbi:hypothetical protein D3C76_1731340 [compost metagenome]
MEERITPISIKGRASRIIPRKMVPKGPVRTGSRTDQSGSGLVAAIRINRMQLHRPMAGGAQRRNAACMAGYLLETGLRACLSLCRR